MDLKERRIRVNVLSPGPIDTPAMQKAPEASRAQFKSVLQVFRRMQRCVGLYPTAT